ncbi:MAG: electron transport complex subunit RsxC [bacterium]|nr:electron transport complex subunit RsxC [bacterium]
MFGGLKIKANKENTRFEKIENLPFPEEVVIYSSQHIGAPSKIIVKKGDVVQKGQLIGECQGLCSMNLHASIGGKVKSISKIARPGGIVCDAVIMSKEGDQTITLMEPLNELTPEKIRARVKEAGIVGLGGAGFPTHLKLNPPKEIDTAFLNGCECEPYLTSDERLMIENSQKIVEGFLFVKNATGAKEGVIVIEDDKIDAIRYMKMAASRYKDIRVVVLPKVYPQGYEKRLITAVTGKEVPSGGLPHDVGVSVHNVGTCFAVYEAVREGKPLIDRVLTLTGPEVINGVNVRATLGMSIKEILGYYQVESRDSYEILMGGPMMGFSLDSIDLAILKTTSGILVKLPEKQSEYPCSVCGKCVEVCPMRLVPQRLNRFFDGGDCAKLNEEGLFDCMECGSCSYICPCNIPLTYKFKAAKTRCN